MAKSGNSSTAGAGFYEPYSHYNNLLRTWLVAYGIGGPAILITHKDLFQDVARNGNLSAIGWLFLTGVASQVLMAFLNKIAMWYLYFGDLNKETKTDLFYRWSHSMAEVFWPDILADVISIASISIATVLLFRSVL